jgi:hypothetical protein
MSPPAAASRDSFALRVEYAMQIEDKAVCDECENLRSPVKSTPR